ncbi:hypothetical protein [Rufibacter roseus]|uniref:DUF3823 domain-containing protein n=1 Tax=Rufibacter roseus TaxID=1567108 RepID=A0ABW2DNS4_9BACT|nr:hypothetical protein [Rufibacter roseus]
MKRQKLLVILAFALSALGLESCYPEPDFDLTPSITYRGVEQYTRRNAQNALFDSLVLVVRFQDGDGNLGLSATLPEDEAAPFNPGSEFYHNFLVNIYRKENGEFVPIRVGNQAINYNGRFPRVSTDTRVEPLEGDIRFSLNIFRNNAIRQGDVIKFDIQIIDRALNKSNVVETSEIVMFSKE